jgi:hypothetical protein
MEDPSKPALDPNAVLTAEFNYIAQTAFQANEDRARVTSFYLITLASFVAAILGAQFEKLSVPQVYYAFVVLFAVLALASFLTVLQLARLRQAWFSSVAALNHLKNYCVKQSPGMNLGDAFAWNVDTTPDKFKPWSLGFMLALQTSVLGGVSVGATLVFAGLIQGAWWWWPAVGAALAASVTQVWLYYWLLRR